MDKIKLIASSYSNELSNKFIKAAKNINEIELNAINNKRKRSFSNFTFFNNNKSKIKELFKKEAINEKIIARNMTSFSLEKYNKKRKCNFGNNLNRNNYKAKPEKNIEIFIKNKTRKNFVLKSELNENYKKLKIQNVENSQQKFEIEQNNINFNNNSNNINNKTNNNLIISKYYEKNMCDNYSNQTINNNNFNFGNNKFVDNQNNINYINYNINNIYLGYPLNQTNPYYNNNQMIYFQNANQEQNNNFINNNQTNYGQLHYLAKSQSGCQFLKNKIINDPQFANEILLPSIAKDLKDICTNILGGSMIQTLLEFLTPENIDLFLFSIKDQIKEICSTEPGSHVMQNLIRKIKDNSLLINKLIFYLNNSDLKTIFKSGYGHHFIKYYLSLIHKKELVYFIFNNIITNFIEIATDKFGVCVVQQAFSEFDGKEVDKLLKLTEKNINLLMKNCFGNYLIQFILLNLKNKFQNTNKIFPLIKKIQENLLDYCKDKYSAAVLEKILEKGEEKLKENLMNYLLNFHSNEIIDILVHPNGFYIIRKGMFIKNKSIKRQIIKAIIDNKNKKEFGCKEEYIINSFCKEFSGYFY